MKTKLLIGLVLAIVVSVLMIACTTPTPKPPTPAQNEQPKNEQTTPPVSVHQPESGVMPESTVTPEATAKGKAGENDPRIIALFKKYPKWPPTSIAPEDIELLSKAVVVLETSKGTIKIKVFPQVAPINSANFVKLASDGFYNGIVFHRVIKGFMSQGGDPTGTGGGGPTPDYTLPAEIGLPHEAGSVAAARLGDNVNPQQRSSGSQFYMCHSTEGCKNLNGQYTVFGKISEGQDVNLALNVTYNNNGEIPGAKPDKIIKAWVEVQ
jgi:cyclophilin family peptidyl-prolyl cis-trans isomerase